MKNGFKLGLSQPNSPKGPLQFRSLSLGQGLDSNDQVTFKGLSRIDQVLKENRKIYSRISRKKPAKR